MFNFFKSVKENSREVNLLARAFGSLNYDIQNDLIPKLEGQVDKSSIVSQVFWLAYYARKGIVVRIAFGRLAYNWTDNYPICVPTKIIGGKLGKGKWTTIEEEMEQTVGKLGEIASEFCIFNEVNEILIGGDLFYDIEKQLPDNLKELDVFFPNQPVPTIKLITSLDLITVTIGRQTWTKENLNVSTFRNGESIPEVQSDEEWEKATHEGKPAWCYYDNDPANGEKYGKLYNWYAVNTSWGLAPEGWHIPSDWEWHILVDYLGGDEKAGNKMKNSLGWENNGNGDNSSGFSAFPSGGRNNLGAYSNVGKLGCFWSGSEYPSTNAWNRFLHYNNSKLNRVNLYMGCGFSVRCIKD